MVGMNNSLESLGMVIFGLVIKEHRFFVNKTALKLAIQYLPDNCYFTLGSMCFRKSIGIPMDSVTTNFYIILQGDGLFKQKYGTYERLVHLQTFLALQMNLKIITAIVILMSWKTRRKTKNLHCVKTACIRSYSGPHFPVFGKKQTATTS